MLSLIRKQLVVLTIGVGFAAPSYGQIRLDPAPNSIDGNQVCTEDNLLQVSDSEDDCTAGAQDITTMTFESGSSLILNNGATATINGAATFGSTVQINGNLTAGNATFTGLVSVQGSSATFATPTFFTFPATFQAPTTFNGTTNFTAGMTTTNITNSGTINTGSLNATTGLSVSAGAAINMGGNVVHGVAAGVADTDAVNVAQLNAATAGISADITALETVTAIHTTQITELQAAIVDLPYIDINSSAGPASATATEAIAVGGDAVASGEASVAIGYQSQATGTNSIAIGNGAVATGSVAIGAGASAANGGSAYGDNSTATGLNSVAVGDGATATADNSVALGAGAVADEAGTVSVGAPGAERQIVNVAAGDVSATSTDVVNGTQLFATNQAVAANTAAIGGLQDDVAILFDLRSEDRRDMKQGVASAMAMASAPMPSEPGRVSYAVNGATFRGEYAVGGSMMYRLNTAAPMAVNVGFSYAGNKNNGARIGIAGEF